MILISGEALIDLIPDPVKANAYDAVLGGSPYNVAIGLGRLGSRTAFVSRISADGNGEALAAALADNRVDLGMVVRDKRPSTLAFVMRGTAKTGSRYSFYLDGTAYDGPWPFPDGVAQRRAAFACRLVFRGREAWRVGRRGDARRSPACDVSFDPNIRPFVTPDREAVRPLVERQASLASMVKASEEDLEWLYPGRSVEESLSVWTKMGPRFCAATLGERGALAIVGRERIEVAAPGSMLSIRSAPATVSCPHCFRRWTGMPRLAQTPLRRRAPISNGGCVSPQPHLQSPAPARGRTRLRAPWSRRR